MSEIQGLTREIQLDCQPKALAGIYGVFVINKTYTKERVSNLRGLNRSWYATPASKIMHVWLFSNPFKNSSRQFLNFLVFVA